MNIYGTDNPENFYGTEEYDQIFAYGGDDKVFGYGGSDQIDGGEGNDVMDGGLGDDKYTVDSLGDTVIERVSEGTDAVFTRIDNYTLANNVEDLYLINFSFVLKGTGNSLNNTIVGNEVNNVIYGLGGKDTIYGEVGNDKLYGGAADDSLNGGLCDDLLDGGSGNDYAQGNSGLDRLEGGIGNDTLVGGTSNDILNGGDENDILAGGYDYDTLTGGAGKDTFQFNSFYRNNDVDVIKDFSVADDVIGFAPYYIGDVLQTGTLKVEQFRIGTSAQDSDDRFIYNKSTGALYFDGDGVGGNSQIQLAKLTTGLSLTHKNINLVGGPF